MSGGIALAAGVSIVVLVQQWSIAEELGKQGAEIDDLQVIVAESTADLQQSINDLTVQMDAQFSNTNLQINLLASAQ